MKIDPFKLGEVQGILKLVAKNQQTITYGGIAELTGLNPRLEVPAYLRELADPRLAACVVTQRTGEPGDGWGNLNIWPQVLKDCHNSYQ